MSRPRGVKSVDWSHDPDPGRVGDAVIELAERVRDEDLRAIYEELREFARRYPGRAAQMLVASAALIDLTEGDDVMNQRLAAVVANRVELVRLGRRPHPGRRAS